MSKFFFMSWVTSVRSEAFQVLFCGVCLYLIESILLWRQLVSRNKTHLTFIISCSSICHWWTPDCKYLLESRNIPVTVSSADITVAGWTSERRVSQTPETLLPENRRKHHCYFSFLWLNMCLYRVWEICDVNSGLHPSTTQTTFVKRMWCLSQCLSQCQS